MSIEFLLTSLVVVLMPGTGVVYTLAVGLGRGFRSSVAAAFGCMLGIVPAAAACIIGLAAVLHTSALIFNAIKILGVMYLLYMAWTVLRAGGAMDVTAESTERTHLGTAVTGTLLNILNPKLSLFFLAFLPQFIGDDPATATGQLVVLAAVFMGMTFAVFVAYGACASLARDYVIRRPEVLRWVRRIFAASFGLLGLRLAMAE